MARFLKHKKEAIGLSPDAITFRGDKKIDYVRLRIIDYDHENLKENEIKGLHEAKQYNSTNTTSWLNIDGLHDENIMNELAESFLIDPVIISEVMNTHGRPKIREYDDCIFISLKMMYYNEEQNEITEENLSLILKEHLLISFQEKPGDVFEPVRNRIRKNKKLIRGSGPDFLAFSLIDVVIDNYIQIISKVGDKIEEIEEKLIQDTSVDILNQINEYKSEISYLRKHIKPVRELIQIFVKTESELLDDKVFKHIKELHDNINLAIDSVESYREILTEQINVYQTTLTNRLNAIMKFLTIFSVIFIPLTFIAGIYGMNFDYMPELEYRFSYPILIGLMIVLGAGMVLYMRFKKWF